jgi:hypothetical protein
MLPFVLVLQVSGAAAPPTLPLRADFYVDEDLTYAVRPPPPPPRRWALPSGFGRFQIGLGPPAFSAETNLLRLEGYDGGKLWFEVDGGYMISALGRHVGGGVWGGIGRWFSPGNAATPALTEVDYMVGLEFPVRFGTSALALLASPRLGIISGTIDVGGDAPSQPAFVWGAQVSAVSSRYHLSVSASYLAAHVGPPGALGRDHDLGGLYFSVGALLDDG